MPDDIRAWLEHLEETEKRRVELAQRQMMSLMVSMQQVKGSELLQALEGLLGDPGEERQEAPSVTEARKVAQDVRPPWQDLATFFRSMPPPESCRIIAADYDQTLNETGATVQDIVNVINTAEADPQAAIAKLHEITKTHKDMIDASALRADQGVQQICDLYETRKWFSIKGDVGGGSPFAMPGISLPSGTP